MKMKIEACLQEMEAYGEDEDRGLSSGRRRLMMKMKMEACLQEDGGL